MENLALKKAMAWSLPRIPSQRNWIEWALMIYWILRSLCDGHLDCPQGDDEDKCPTLLSTQAPQTITNAFTATEKPTNMTSSKSGSTGQVYTTNPTTAQSRTKMTSSSGRASTQMTSPTSVSQPSLVHTSLPSQLMTNPPSTPTPMSTTTPPSPSERE